MNENRKIKPTPFFIEIIKNTIIDFENLSSNNEEIETLQNIINSDNVNLYSSYCVYNILDLRKMNLKTVKKLQDKETFKIINKEHKYLRSFLDKYFINNIKYLKHSEGYNASGSVSYKEMK